MKFSINHYKVRSTQLQRIGFSSYEEYLAGEWWTQRKLAYAKSHPALCAVCRKRADDLHHKSYGRLGAEVDSDLLWLCRRHHVEVHDRGILGRPTNAMKAILLERGWSHDCIEILSFGDAFEVIAGKTGPTAFPQDGKLWQQLDLSDDQISSDLADDPEIMAVLLDC